MSLSAAFRSRANTFDSKAIRLSITLVDSANPPGLALLLSGDLDTDSSSRFQSFVLEVLSGMEPSTTLILDLSTLIYISSTGVGSLTAILCESRMRQIGLSLCGIPQQVWNIIDLLGFTTFFSFIDSYEACP